MTAPGAPASSKIRSSLSKAGARFLGGSQADPSTSASSSSDGRADDRSTELTAVVECEIIPRLMLAHATGLDHRAHAGANDVEIDADLVDAFARLTLTSDPDRLLAFVSDLISRGRGLNEIYRDLLAPAARQLGTYWSDDLVAYADVTIALGRLQHLIRLMGWQAGKGADPSLSGQAALFAPAPGEQHIFGLILVEDSFRRAGWRTWLETESDPDTVGRAVAQHWFDVAGFSLGNLGLADRLADTIRQIRRLSRNREIFILVGGNPVQNDPNLVKDLGADATAADGFQALTLAEERVCHRA